MTLEMDIDDVCDMIEDADVPSVQAIEFVKGVSAYVTCVLEDDPSDMDEAAVVKALEDARTHLEAAVKSLRAWRKASR